MGRHRCPLSSSCRHWSRPWGPDPRWYPMCPGSTDTTARPIGSRWDPRNPRNLGSTNEWCSRDPSVDSSTLEAHRSRSLGSRTVPTSSPHRRNRDTRRSIYSSPPTDWHRPKPCQHHQPLDRSSGPPRNARRRTPRPDRDCPTKLGRRYRPRSPNAWPISGRICRGTRYRSP